MFISFGLVCGIALVGFTAIFPKRVGRVSPDEVWSKWHTKSDVGKTRRKITIRYSPQRNLCPGKERADELQQSRSRTEENGLWWLHDHESEENEREFMFYTSSEEWSRSQAPWTSRNGSLSTGSSPPRRFSNACTFGLASSSAAFLLYGAVVPAYFTEGDFRPFPPMVSICISSLTDKWSALYILRN